MRKLFTLLIFLISLPGSGQTSINLYQYWFNGDIDASVTQTPDGLSANLTLSLEIPAGSLPNGLHAYHIRFRDEDRRWSSPLSRFFYKMPVSPVTEKNIRQYQYWFNNDQANSVSGVTAGGGVIQLDETVDVAGMPGGLHAFHIRFQDEGGRWSSPLSRFFYRMPVSPVTEKNIRQYQYWFNNDQANSVSGVTAGGGVIQLDETVDVAGMPGGLHAFHIRFRDETGRWSSPLSRFFYKMPVSPETENNIRQYQYWFNNDRENSVSGVTAGGGLIQFDEAVDVAGMPGGLHAFHIRFRDETGRWSSPLSRFFYRMPSAGPYEDNLVKAYRYWFSEGDKNMFRVDLDQPVSPLHLIAEIETPYLEPGMHDLNIQFLDLNGKWSSVLTQEFEIEDCLPRFIGEPEGVVEVCGGTTELYTSDAALNITDFEWTLFPPEAGVIIENGSAAEVEWNSSFAGDAVLSVMGYNPCGETAARSLTVSVVPAPYVMAMDDAVICEGESIALTVTESVGTVEWNVEELLVSPQQETSYTVTATNICGVSEDVVVVGVVSYPSLSVMDDVAVCEGEQVELTAASDGVVTWSGGSEVVSPAETTVYTATAQNGECSVQDQVTVTVNPVPDLTVMEDIAICEGEQVELTAVSDGVVTWSGGETIVSPSTTTTYTATSVKDGCEAAAEVTITVKPLPLLSVMDDVAICEGEQVELTATSDGTVTWSGGETIVSPSTTTTYTATSVKDGCEVAAEVTITVKPLPLLSVMDDVAICEGEQIELTAVSDGVVTWSSGSAIVSPAESNLYTAFAEKEGCVVQQDLFVTVHPVPETPVLEQVDETLISSSGSEHIWFFNNFLLEGVSGQEYSPESDGEYYVQVVSTKGCISGPSNIILFTVSSIIKTGMNEISVFPNPVHDKLFINPGSNLGEFVKVELMTVGGSILILRKINDESYINVSSLPPSVYILRVSQGDESRILRIIKN